MTQAQIPPRMSARGPMPDGHWIVAEPSPRWVRNFFGGETIADSRRVMLFRENRVLPVYYFPTADVRMDLLQPTGQTSHDDRKGEAERFNVGAGGRVAEDAAWRFTQPLEEWPEITEHVAFTWAALDRWMEEEEEVFVHPRDPYKRVDVMPSSRRVEVVWNGQTLADTRQPRLLFETGLPVRYYIPEEDVRMDLLQATGTHTRCPYKGQASYWSAEVDGRVSKDLVWSYPDPIPEAPKIRGLLCFFNERVDAIKVDGEEQPKPQTRWSQPPD
jgi:uncharacterized protein (DUF427 family)